MSVILPDLFQAKCIIVMKIIVSVLKHRRSQFMCKAIVVIVIARVQTKVECIHSQRYPDIVRRIDTSWISSLSSSFEGEAFFGAGAAGAAASFSSPFAFAASPLMHLTPAPQYSVARIPYDDRHPPRFGETAHSRRTEAKAMWAPLPPWGGQSRVSETVSRWNLRSSEHYFRAMLLLCVLSSTSGCNARSRSTYTIWLIPVRIEERM